MTLVDEVAEAVLPELTDLGSELQQNTAALVRRVQASVVRVIGGEQGIGSGVVWRIDGSIITNDHVVAASNGRLAIELEDGRRYRAEAVVRNPAYDLALLAVHGVAPGELRVVAVGDAARLRVGELVFAVGNPWGQRNIVTAGIVSGFGQAMLSGIATPLRYILSDVLLRPGNSGGPLVNAYGGVIGINAMIRGGDLSVAIPVDVVQAWLNSRDFLL